MGAGAGHFAFVLFPGHSAGLGGQRLPHWLSDRSLDGQSHAGSADIFLMKFDSSRAWQWTRERGTLRSYYSRGIALDSEGNAFLTGHTHGSLGGESSAGSTDIFLMKFDASGAWQWTR